MDAPVLVNIGEIQPLDAENLLEDNRWQMRHKQRPYVDKLACNRATHATAMRNNAISVGRSHGSSRRGP